MPLKRKTNWKKKSIALAKEVARRKGYCEYCGATDKQLQGSHIFPIEYLPTAADPNNILCLCAGCHKFSKHAWHKSPQIAVWFYCQQEERYMKLIAKAYHGEKPDWESEYRLLEGMSQMES